ncbi:MAG TPA: hypothetical protein PKK33_01400 [Candidatus Cloacimonadota bacterium]|nr:hypothetical protein [Candidatus Cloacimonadota bacterium]
MIDENGGIMRNVLIILIVCGTFISLFSYPTYDLRENFTSLAFDKSQEPPYTLQRNCPYMEDFGKSVGLMPYPLTLFWNPELKVLKSYDSERTEIYWTTNRLTYIPRNGNIMGEMIDGGFFEVWTPVNKNGDCLLQDRFTKRYVLKRQSGKEIFLPRSLDDMKWYPTTFEVQFLAEWLFVSGKNNKVNYGFIGEKGKFIHGNPIHLAVTSDTISYVWETPNKKDILIQYGSKVDSTGLILVSRKGEALWHCPNLKEYDRVELNGKFMNYALLSNQTNSSKMIVDLRNGQILAEVLCKCMAIAEVQDTLFAIVANDKSAGVIDLTRGRLIQDFSNDLFPITDVQLVKIAKVGYQILIKGFKSDKEKDSRIYILKSYI